MDQPKPLRRRGRPAGRQLVARTQILDALVRLLDSAPLSRPTLRTVAVEAGVSQSLLHYHFADLPGLLHCLHEERALPLLQPLLHELQSAELNCGAALIRFLQKWTALTLRHPWLAAALLQSTAPTPETRLGCGEAIRTAVARAQLQGTVRRDLPDHYIALLLLSLGVMPHLARTRLATGITKGMDTQPQFAPEGVAALTLLHLSVLQAGVAERHSPRQDSTS